MLYLLTGSCGPAVYCPKTQNPSLIFYWQCFISDWNIYIFLFCFYIMLGSYATDVKVTVLIKICMTLGEQHCWESASFSSLWICPMVSCHLSPTSWFVSAWCLSKLHGNGKWWKIVLVLLFCGKQLSTWCLYLVPFLIIKIHVKTIIILCLYSLKKTCFICGFQININSIQKLNKAAFITHIIAFKHLIKFGKAYLTDTWYLRAIHEGSTYLRVGVANWRIQRCGGPRFRIKWNFRWDFLGFLTFFHRCLVHYYFLLLFKTEIKGFHWSFNFKVLSLLL